MDAVARLPSPAAEARCQAHPEESVLGACARCGTFFCGRDRASVDGTDYCAPCAARPDVDYLEAFRRKYWGRRDVWAWLIGLGALLNGAGGLMMLLSEGTRERWLALLPLGYGVFGGCFWWGKPFARPLLCLAPLLGMGVGLLSGSPLAIAPWVLPLIISVGIYLDTRNQLFFKQEVSRAALQKAWHLYANNSMARAGLILSFFGLLLPVFAPFGLLCSFIGLRRVDPTARPPIGRKGYALAGIVLGAMGVLGWGVLVLSLYAVKWGR